MNLTQSITVFSYGTSEGVSKAWDTRGRGRKTEETSSTQVGNYQVSKASHEEVQGILKDWTALAKEKGDYRIRENVSVLSQEFQSPRGDYAILKDGDGVWGIMSVTNSEKDMYVNGILANPDVMDWEADKPDVGRSMMSYIAQQAGDKPIYLQASEPNFKFYQKLGFKVTDEYSGEMALDKEGVKKLAAWKPSTPGVAGL